MLCSCSCIHRAPGACVTATEVSPDSPPRPPGVVSGIAPRCVSGPHLQNSHVISLGQFLIIPTNVAIPTMPIQCLKGLHGNYVRNCRAHTRRHWRGGWPRRPAASDYDSETSPATSSSTTPHQRPIPGPSPPPAPVSTAVCPNRRPPCPKHPKNAHFHRSGLHFEHTSQKSHVISLGQFLISPTNVAIPTVRIQSLK